jgi:hypothetical protein
VTASVCAEVCPGLRVGFEEGAERLCRVPRERRDRVGDDVELAVPHGEVRSHPAFDFERRPGVPLASLVGLFLGLVDVRDGPAGDLCEDVGGLLEGDGFSAGEPVRLPLVPVAGEHCDAGVGDVVA